MRFIAFAPLAMPGLKKKTTERGYGTHKCVDHAGWFVKDLSILVIGGGIGGLTSAIALRRQGFVVEVVERDPDWTVYGVGIIQQANVVRAVAELGILDDYVDAGCAFEHIEVYIPTGARVARFPTPRLAEGYPSNVGIGRPALHKVLGDRTIASGASVRLGITADVIMDDGDGVDVTFSDGSHARYGLVIGADGLYSQTRAALFPDAPVPRFVGQGVWRYNFDRPAGMDALCIYEGPLGIGLVPLSETKMYMFVTTPEPGNPWYPLEGLAAAMRDKLRGVPAPQIRALADQITDDAAVVYKPLEALFIEGDWHKGRVALVGDAVHATTPHLGQGAGMAIEDSLVLAQELAKADDVDGALRAFRDRRYERCRYIVEASLAICTAQVRDQPFDQAAATKGMFEVVTRPI
jgi:2-polyprenyl-6-methoxyphenol hydroxylase-like FAD-dependent oxidoreductase